MQTTENKFEWNYAIKNDLLTTQQWKFNLAGFTPKEWSVHVAELQRLEFRWESYFNILRKKKIFL